MEDGREAMGSLALSSPPMSSPRRVRVGVLGAGAWARSAHLPGFARDSRCENRRHRRHQPRAGRRGRGEIRHPAGLRLARGAHRPRRARPDRRVHAEQHAFRAVVGGARIRPPRAVREAGRVRLPRHPAGRRTGPLEGPQDQARVHLPLRAGGALHAPAGRRRLRRHAVHLQRLRAELAVARPDEPAAPGRSRTPTRTSCTSRRSRATARRSSTSRICWSAATSPR